MMLLLQTSVTGFSSLWPTSSTPVTHVARYAASPCSVTMQHDGKGFGGGSALGSSVSQGAPFPFALAGGKKGGKGSGKGFYGKTSSSPSGGNPVGSDGKQMLCHECGSNQHLVRDCPARNGRSTSSG